MMYFYIKYTYLTYAGTTITGGQRCLDTLDHCRKIEWRSVLVLQHQHQHLPLHLVASVDSASTQPQPQRPVRLHRFLGLRLRLLLPQQPLHWVAVHSASVPHRHLLLPRPLSALELAPLLPNLRPLREHLRSASVLCLHLRRQRAQVSA